jgi:hypothetical protein
LYVSDEQAEDQPESPSVAANVDMVPLEMPQPVERVVVESAGVAQGILGCHSALVVSRILNSSTFVELSSTFVLIVLCWQNLAKQVAEQAEFLRRAGEDIQLTADQSL